MSDRNLTFVVAAVLLLTSAGCWRRPVRAAFPDLVIPVSCASQITLLQCDARVNPPKCKTARVKYHSGCEQIVVTQGR
jgi:hypothetical protein